MTTTEFLILGGLLLAVLIRQQQTKGAIMAKVSSLASTLNAIGDRLDKVKQEVQALKDSLSDVDIPAEAQAALDRLSAAAEALDALNPDAPTTPPPGT